MFTIGQNVIETVDIYKYLGVIFHEKKKERRISALPRIHYLKELVEHLAD